MTNTQCPVCGGSRKEGLTTFTADYKSALVVIRNVPAFICSQCGEEWITDDIAAKVESLASSAHKEKKQIEVVDFSEAVPA